MAKQLLTIQLEPEHATIEEVTKRLDLGAEDIDEDFGVVCIDPREGLYTVLVDEEAAGIAADHPDVEGPWENPAIEATGAPQPDA